MKTQRGSYCKDINTIQRPLNCATLHKRVAKIKQKPQLKNPSNSTRCQQNSSLSVKSKVPQAEEERSLCGFKWHVGAAQQHTIRSVCTLKQQKSHRAFLLCVHLFAHRQRKAGLMPEVAGGRGSFSGSGPSRHVPAACSSSAR